ncbi:hypothetical protein D9615_004734 [Tricholomella constricta]|uniref:Gti1/Pac2 family-domain-containing protein n=1 Tax=Tricholomella constricta TaxID=117010 RepID=A0A8H5HBX0_9AGAR|nr:hypothetical protein D9615_004734 [Tricholomella constricta]
MVSRRLDTDERRYITSGCVFVWEERGPNAEATGIGIERWTDSIRWGPSRVRDEFLYYHEREATPIDRETPSSSCATSPLHPGQLARGQRRGNLIKQTYSVFVETARGRRKWHLIAYFTQDSLDYLRTVDDLPHLASVSVPPGKYRSARSGNRGGRPHPQGFELIVAHLPYTSRPTTSVPNHPGPQPVTSSSLFNRASAVLAPLEYLKNIPPHRRHPVDEEALMSFAKKPAWIT